MGSKSKVPKSRLGLQIPLGGLKSFSPLLASCVISSRCDSSRAVLEDPSLRVPRK